MAAGVHDTDDPRGQRAAVERVRAVARDLAERVRKLRVAQHGADTERAAVREHAAVALGEARELRGIRTDEAGQDLSDRETVLREPDRRREHLLTRQPAEPLMRGEESRDVAGHPDDAQVGTAVVAGTSAEPLDRLHRVEVEVLRALRVVQPDQHGTATADAGHLRLDHADRECRGDGGVDCVAAGAQHLDAGLTRERTRRRDRAVGTDRHAANLRRGRLQDTLLRCGRGARCDNEHPRDPAYD